jgi:hypothetical protein
VDVAPLASDRPLGKWYLYYSPHDAPGGICLAYADHLQGPWTEYGANPLISNRWDPHYRVSHVAAPHALWIAEEGRLFLWFHGENHTTRFASSEDGIRFRYEGIAALASDIPAADGNSCFYGRVFRHTLPSVVNSRYILMITAAYQKRQTIVLAHSPDARAWTFRPNPLIAIPDELGGHGASPWLLRAADGLYVVCHAGRIVNMPHEVPADLVATPVTEDLVPTGPTRLLRRASSGAPDFGRISDFAFATDEGGSHFVFCVEGVRLRQQLQIIPVTFCVNGGGAEHGIGGAGQPTTQY